jgi:hypothetical protein
MDESDQATDREIKDRELLMNVKKPVGPEATGYCLNCEVRVQKDQRWCDIYCKEDWEARVHLGNKGG